MLSVTKRIDQVDQPIGGYIRPKLFKVTELIDKEKIYQIDTSYRTIQGMAVDYLTRFACGSPKEEAFHISLLGAEEVNEKENAEKLLCSITGLDQNSIIAACQLVGYDVAYRRGPKYFMPVNRIDPNKNVIRNIKTMVKRSIKFFDLYGPIECSEVTFEGGYNEIISSGDGDFLTSDTLWDFKVSKEGLNSKYTLQLLVYYILGLHSVHEIFQQIKKIGVYNPERNEVYELEVSKISDKTFYEVSLQIKSQG